MAGTITPAGKKIILFSPEAVPCGGMPFRRSYSMCAAWPPPRPRRNNSPPTSSPVAGTRRSRPSRPDGNRRNRKATDYLNTLSPPAPWFFGSRGGDKIARQGISGVRKNEGGVRNTPAFVSILTKLLEVMIVLSPYKSRNNQL